MTHFKVSNICLSKRLILSHNDLVQLPCLI